MHPGDYRVLTQLEQVASRTSLPLEVRKDGQCLIGLENFRSWAGGRKSLRLEHLDWPVTPEQATEALEDFVAHPMAAFGPFQDALWTGKTYLYHLRL